VRDVILGHGSAILRIACNKDVSMLFEDTEEKLEMSSYGIFEEFRRQCVQ